MRTVGWLAMTSSVARPSQSGVGRNGSKTMIPATPGPGFGDGQRTGRGRGPSWVSSGGGTCGSGLGGGAAGGPTVAPPPAWPGSEISIASPPHWMRSFPPPG